MYVPAERSTALSTYIYLRVLKYMKVRIKTAIISHYVTYLIKSDLCLLNIVLFE